MRKHPFDPAPPPDDSLTAAVQPLLEKVATTGQVEDGWISRAWELYETPEVRFAARQYSNAFSSAKLVLARREVVGRDPVPILEPKNAVENKAYELLQSFAGGTDGQTELLDRMGTYFIVPGDMILVGAYDPAKMLEADPSAKFAKWDVWSTSEVRWDGQRVHIRTSPVEDRFQTMPDYIKHLRIWNRHPRYGWQSDSPVRASLNVLELVGLYDDRLAAEALSRLIGAGVWFLPQGLSLPTSTGDPSGGTPNDFLRLMKEVASLAIKDRRSAAAMVPILVEAAAEDIAAMKDSHFSFSTGFDERIGELQQGAIRRWATGVDLPAENMLGLSQATHWNASLISEDKVQSFVVPSLRRAVGNLTAGWLRPALAEFAMSDPSLVLWFDPSGIRTRIDLAEESQWASDRFMLSDADRRYATGLSQTNEPDEADLKRQMLLHMARQNPESIPFVLKELGIEVGDDFLEALASSPGRGDDGATPRPARRPGPQPTDQQMPGGTSSPGRTAQLETRQV